VLAINLTLSGETEPTLKTSNIGNIFKVDNTQYSVSKGAAAALLKEIPFQYLSTLNL
jgi:hypothetical protein